MIDPNRSYPDVPYNNDSDKRRDRLIITIENDQLVLRRASARRSIPDDVFMLSWDMTRRVSNRLLPIIEKVMQSNPAPFSEKLVINLWLLGEQEDSLEWV